MVMSIVAITGIDSVLAQINRRVAAMKAKSRGAMREAVLLVRGRSQRLTPVDTGNLKGSAYTEVSAKISSVTGVIGYQAFYAVYVHERVQHGSRSQRFNVQHKTGQAKFLETALKESERDIVDIYDRWLQI
jgi:hypothetical protein